MGFSINFFSFESIFSRYVVEEEVINNLSLKGYDVTSVTSVTRTAEYEKKGQKSENEKKPLGHHNRRNSRNDVTEEFVESASKGDVKYHIERLGKGEIAIEQLKEDLDITDDYVDKLLRDGDVFESKAGFVKINK